MLRARQGWQGAFLRSRSRWKKSGHKCHLVAQHVGCTRPWFGVVDICKHSSMFALYFAPLTSLEFLPLSGSTQRRNGVHKNNTGISCHTQYGFRVMTLLFNRCMSGKQCFAYIQCRGTSRIRRTVLRVVWITVLINCKRRCVYNGSRLYLSHDTWRMPFKNALLS